MAERRMFTQKIVDSDAFLDMPLSTQALYFHLNMRADDDGFVNNPKKIQRMIGASDDDLKLLLAKRFILGFESGVIVIKHWKMHNWIRKDRYNQTQYLEELQMLTVKDDGAYTERPVEFPEIPACQPDVNQLTYQPQPQVRLGKDRLGKDRLEDGENTKTKRQRFVPPTLEEVKEYCKDNAPSVDPQRFIDFYSSKGWMVGKNKMKDWKAAVRGWQARDRKGAKAQEPIDYGDPTDFYK